MESRRFFSFCPFEINDPAEALSLVSGRLLPGHLIRIDKFNDFVEFTEFGLNPLSGAPLVFPEHYVYEVLRDGDLKYIDSNMKD